MTISTDISEGSAVYQIQPNLASAAILPVEQPGEDSELGLADLVIAAVLLELGVECPHGLDSRLQCSNFTTAVEGPVAG